MPQGHEILHNQSEQMSFLTRSLLKSWPKNTQFETSGGSFWSLKRYLQAKHKPIIANGKLIVF